MYVPRKAENRDMSYEKHLSMPLDVNEPKKHFTFPADRVCEGNGNSTNAPSYY
jgi:hypothetical protein